MLGKRRMADINEPTDDTDAPEPIDNELLASFLDDDASIDWEEIAAVALMKTFRLIRPSRGFRWMLEGTLTASYTLRRCRLVLLPRVSAAASNGCRQQRPMNDGAGKMDDDDSGGDVDYVSSMTTRTTTR